MGMWNGLLNTAAVACVALSCLLTTGREGVQAAEPKGQPIKGGEFEFHDGVELDVWAIVRQGDSVGGGGAEQGGRGAGQAGGDCDGGYGEFAG